MEKVEIIGHETYDDDGNLVETPLTGLVDAVVSPMDWESTVHSDTDTHMERLQLLCPPGVAVSVGDTVVLTQRGGDIYEVEEIPFDWSVGRRPVNPRHRPKLKLIIKRVEA